MAEIPRRDRSTRPSVTRSERDAEAAMSPSPSALWGKHAAELIRYATLLAGPNDAQDIASIAFHSVIGQIGAGATPDNVRAYLFRAVTNASHDQHRSRRRRHRRDHRASVMQPVSTSHGPTEDGVDVRRAVADLSVQQRAVVYFTYWEDLDSQQVGRLLDIAPATVRRHLARARIQLRKELS